MTKLTNRKNNIPVFKVKTSTIEDFSSKAKAAMRAADRNESIESNYTLTFEDPTELLHFLSTAKLQLINSIRKHPDSVTNIAKAVNRNRASVYRDANELEKVGIVQTSDEVNPGHGRHKIVKITAKKLTLEAAIF